jgi:hypothetical protein
MPASPRESHSMELQPYYPAKGVSHKTNVGFRMRFPVRRFCFCSPNGIARAALACESCGRCEACGSRCVEDGRRLTGPIISLQPKTLPPYGATVVELEGMTGKCQRRRGLSHRDGTAFSALAPIGTACLLSPRSKITC